jgi:hypothetical protein
MVITMTNLSATTENSHYVQKRLVQMAGTLLILTGIVFLVGAVLLIAQGMPAATIEEKLAAIANRPLLYQASNGLFMLSDLLPIPATLVLYLALKNRRYILALLSTSLGVSGALVAIVMRIGMHALGPISLSYVSAISDVQRASYLAVGEAIVSVTDPGLTLANLLLFTLTLLISLAMWKSDFSRFSSIVGIITGVIGLFGIGLLAAPGWLIWFFIVGVDLFRIAKTKET